MVAWLSGLLATACRQPPKAAPSSLVVRETTGPADTKITAATTADLARIEEQAAVAGRLAKSHGGSELRGTLADLQVLQRVVDSRALAPTERYELQCLGSALALPSAAARGRAVAMSDGPRRALAAERGVAADGGSHGAFARVPVPPRSCRHGKHPGQPESVSLLPAQQGVRLHRTGICTGRAA